jgi:hypothetical protein
MKTDLTTGKVSLVLLSDWVKGIDAEPATTSLIPYPQTTIKLGMKPFGDGYLTVDPPLETSFITPIPTLSATFLTDGVLEIVVAENTTSAIRTNTLPVTYYTSDGSVILSTFIYIIQDFQRNYLLKEDGGYLLTEDYNKILL